jgi:hypothetical protein
MTYDPLICKNCGAVESRLQREFDLDCICGGEWALPPYQFTEKAAAKSSTSTMIDTPGNIACQNCGCRDRKRMGCECSCHEEA